jgi:hypothetical protein
MALTNQTAAQFLVVSAISQAIDLGALHHLKHEIDFRTVLGLATYETMTGIRDLIVPSEKLRRDFLRDTASHAAFIFNAEGTRHVSWMTSERMRGRNAR